MGVKGQVDIRIVVQYAVLSNSCDSTVILKTFYFDVSRSGKDGVIL